ncbi:MAG: sigma 54-interacting transcriptional regulator [Planctomycetes bacterium]|nr:sigma 54-interacting transcriptional regulator [Planctomycetota bacterium]
MTEPTPAAASTHDAFAARRLDALLSILPVGVFTIGHDQHIRSINPEAARLTGLDPVAAIGRNCREVLRCAFCTDKCAAQQAMCEGEVFRDCPVDITRPDGSQVCLRIDAAPVGDGEVAVTLRDVTEAERLRRALRDRWVFHGMVGVSPAFKQVVGQIRDVAPYDTTVLVLGESGTGKELVARAIHAESPRAAKPFVTVTCSAYSESLLESELFGHVRGAFTGAERDRPGRFEVAEGGTVFLDEIGEISPKIQVKLLRVLQEREVERVGENRPRSVDVRIVAATNKDLLREVREGRFRDDLYYRLAVLTMHLPPLRDRHDDVPALVDYLLQRASIRTGKEVRAVAEDAMERLLAHPWPGNVRELENVLESAVVRSHDGTVHVADLPEDVGVAASGAPPTERMRDALRRAAGSVTLAARLLGVHRTTVWRWMTEAGVKREDFLPT